MAVWTVHSELYEVSTYPSAYPLLYIGLYNSFERKEHQSMSFFSAAHLRPLKSINSPFPSCLKPLYQSEAWCTTNRMKISLIYM